jgi:hypothetical protein
MKAFIVTSMVDMLDRQHGSGQVDAILADAGLTGLRGVDPHSDVPVQSIVRLSMVAAEALNTEVDDLVEQFGWYIFGVLVIEFPDQVSQPDFHAFLRAVNTQIHPEMRRRFPNAEVPTVTVEEADGDSFLVRYASKRPFTRLACGIISAASTHFGLISTVTVKESRFDEATGQHESLMWVRPLGG